MRAASLTLAAVASGAIACGFQPAQANFDATPIRDVEVDTLAVLPRSCKEIHAADAAKPSGAYEIDPDGNGGGAPLTVTCDMVTDSGGWTIVFLAPDNVSTTPDYTSSTPELLGDATSALIAYRDDTQTVVSSFAIFGVPADWRLQTPFAAANTDLPTSVRIDSGAASARIVRYGYQSFANDCGDAWITNETQFGRLCIIGTTAPFYSGFASALVDQCSTSNVAWNATPCSSALKFSIAVR